MTIYYHIYLHQYSKYLKEDLIASKATNQKQEIFSCLRWHQMTNNLSLDLDLKLNLFVPYIVAIASLKTDHQKMEKY